MKSVYVIICSASGFILNIIRPAYLNIMLCKLFGKGAPTRGQGIHCIIDCNLTVFVTQETVNVLAALSYNFLAKQNR